MADAPVTREWTHDGRRLVYDEYGSGDRPFVLVHGLLLSRRMHAPLAATLAEAGHRVIVPDLLGHGDSEAPRDMSRYSMPIFGEQIVGLLDHLELEKVVLGGTSLGANVTLEVAVRSEERLQGLFIEMPVLDNALLGCALAFTPLLVGFTLAEPAARLLMRSFRIIPRGLHPLGDTVLEAISQEPGPAGSVLQGLLFGEVAPHRRQRAQIETPTLVLGHPRDPVHPFSDAGMLVREMPNARMVEANSIIELRVRPDRLTGEICRFLDACWEETLPRARAARPRSAAKRSTSARQKSAAPARRTSATQRRSG